MTNENLKNEYNRWHEARLPTDATLGLHPSEERFYAWLYKLLEAHRGGRLLDVACGQGGFLAYAQKQGLRVTGVDVSDVAVETARARVPEAEVIVGEGEQLPFDDDSFDYVTCIGSLEHFPQRKRGAGELARVLKPSGTAVVFVPNLFFLGHVYFGLRHGTQPTEGGQAFSEMFMSSRGWHELLSSAGLDVRDFRAWNHIFATDRVSPHVMKTWNVVSRVLPRNGAYAFAFVCSKGREARR